MDVDAILEEMRAGNISSVLYYVWGLEKRAEAAEAECRRFREAMKFHPDVISAHAQFGGNLIEMQHAYGAGEKS